MASTTCVNPQNQNIYQALLDNAEYKTAEMVYNLDYDLSKIIIIPDFNEGRGNILPQFVQDVRWFLFNSKKITQSVRQRMMDAVEGKSVPSPLTTTCVNPKNQSIYQALLGKAASYPASATQESYQAKAYKKVAESIAAHKKSIYDDLILGKWDWTRMCIAGIGPSIEKFINDFIEANPQRPQYYAEEAMSDARKIAAQNAPAVTSCPLVDPVGSWPMEAQNAFEEMKRNILGPEEPTRRSARLAAKPNKSYKKTDPYDSEDIPDDAEVDDEKDEDYVPQQDEESDDEDEESELMMLFRKNTKKYILTDDELKEAVKIFEAYYEANKENKDERTIWYQEYDWQTAMYGNYKMMPMKEVVYNYISDSTCYIWKSLDEVPCRLHNPILNKAHFNKTFKNILIKEVGKLGIDYDERLMDGFFNWFMDPAKKTQSHYTSSYSSDIQWFRRTKNDATRQYIKSIPKKFIF